VNLRKNRTPSDLDTTPTATVTPGRGTGVTTPTRLTASRRKRLVKTGSTASRSERHGADTATDRPERGTDGTQKRLRPPHTFVSSPRRHTLAATSSHTPVKQLRHNSVGSRPTTPSDDFVRHVRGYYQYHSPLSLTTRLLSFTVLNYYTSRLLSFTV